MMFKKWLVSLLFNQLEAFIEENWDTIVAEGKDYALQLIATIKGKLFPEKAVFSSQDPKLCNFSARLDEAIARGEIEAESGS